MIFIDTETTGLCKEHDEILELCIMDSAGGVLYNERFRPEWVESWPAAEAVNHISPADVENCVPFRHSQDADEAIRHLMPAGAVVAGWNVQFDIDMLRAGGADIPMVQLEDVMKLYADMYGEIMPDGRRKWSKLTDAAANIGYKLPDHLHPHSALADCALTRAVYKHIMTFYHALYNEDLRAAVLDARESMKAVQYELHRIHEALAAHTVIEADNPERVKNVQAASLALNFLVPILAKEVANLEEGLTHGKTDCKP